MALSQYIKHGFSLFITQVFSDNIVSFALGNSTDSGMARPMIGQEQPSYEVSGFLIDSIGCKWKFKKDYTFTLRGIELTVRPGSEIEFGDNRVLLRNVEMRTDSGSQ
jgi:hypothetical protein